MIVRYLIDACLCASQKRITKDSIMPTHSPLLHTEMNINC